MVMGLGPTYLIPMRMVRGLGPRLGGFVFGGVFFQGSHYNLCNINANGEGFRI
jgi:hypothetical protein